MCVRVVNVRGMHRAADRAGVVYVGREWAGWLEHDLHNPFRPVKTPECVQGDVVAACLDRFRDHLAKRVTLESDLWALWEETEGGKKPLGCWCVTATAGDGQPVVCHAQILAELLRERFCTENIYGEGR